MNDVTREVCNAIRFGSNPEDQIAGLDAENAALRTALADAKSALERCRETRRQEREAWEERAVNDERQIENTTTLLNDALRNAAGMRAQLADAQRERDAALSRATATAKVLGEVLDSPLIQHEDDGDYTTTVRKRMQPDLLTRAEAFAQGKGECGEWNAAINAAIAEVVSEEGPYHPSVAALRAMLKEDAR